MPDNKILILGLGNEILTDDSIGPRLVRSLERELDRQEIEFSTACCGGLEIMEAIRGYKKAVLIDAIRTKSGSPGTVYYFNPSAFRETSNLSNLHDINFITALRLGNILELDLPADLHIIAVEIVEDRIFSESLTPVMAMKYPDILEEVYTMVKDITNT